MTDLEELKSDFTRIQRDFDSKVGQLKEVQLQLESVDSELNALSDEIESYGKVLGIFNSLSSSIQVEFFTVVEKLISEGLTSVFQESINFKIESSIKSQQVSLEFYLEDSDGNKTPLIDSRGGGLVSLCGLLLRILMVRLMRNKVAQVLILDEPLAHLSVEYRSSAGELISTLSKRLGIQILMVSHLPELNEYADRLYELVKTSSGVQAQLVV